MSTALPNSLPKLTRPNRIGRQRVRVSGDNSAFTGNDSPGPIVQGQDLKATSN